MDKEEKGIIESEEDEEIDDGENLLSSIGSEGALDYFTNTTDKKKEKKTEDTQDFSMAKIVAKNILEELEKESSEEDNLHEIDAQIDPESER